MKDAIRDLSSLIICVALMDIILKNEGSGADLGALWAVAIFYLVSMIEDVVNQIKNKK